MIRKIAYWSLLSLSSLYVLAFFTLGSASTASPSVLKDRATLVWDLYAVLTFGVAIGFLAKGWWRTLCLPPVIIGGLANQAGWQTEAARFHDAPLARLLPGSWEDAAVIIVSMVLVAGIVLLIRVLDPRGVQRSANGITAEVPGGTRNGPPSADNDDHAPT